MTSSLYSADETGRADAACLAAGCSAACTSQGCSRQQQLSRPVSQVQQQNLLSYMGWLQPELAHQLLTCRGPCLSSCQVQAPLAHSFGSHGVQGCSIQLAHAGVVPTGLAQVPDPQDTHPPEKVLPCCLNQASRQATSHKM